MAIRKAKVKEQMDAALSPVLEAGEQVRAEGLALGGISPWWVMAGYIAAAFIKPYYIAVTDRRVIFFKMSYWTGRPVGLLRTDPRDQVSVDGFKPGGIYSAFWYTAPGGERKKLRFHRIWKDEMTAVVQALGAPASAQA